MLQKEQEETRGLLIDFDYSTNINEESSPAVGRRTVSYKRSETLIGSRISQGTLPSTLR